VVDLTQAHKSAEQSKAGLAEVSAFKRQSTANSKAVMLTAAPVPASPTPAPAPPPRPWRPARNLPARPPNPDNLPHYCAHHGWNSQHVTPACFYLKNLFTAQSTAATAVPGKASSSGRGGGPITKSRYPPPLGSSGASTSQPKPAQKGVTFKPASSVSPVLIAEVQDDDDAIYLSHYPDDNICAVSIPISGDVAVGSVVSARRNAEFLCHPSC